jgi:DNA-binding IclR family transcriptional regulator
VPLLNFAGQAVGAISIAGTSTKLEGERLDALADRMKSAGDYLSRRLGFLGSSTNGHVATGLQEPTET